MTVTTDRLLEQLKKCVTILKAYDLARPNKHSYHPTGGQVMLAIEAHSAEMELFWMAATYFDTGNDVDWLREADEAR